MRCIKNVSILFLIVAALCLEQIVTACGGGEDPYDYYLSFFHNNTAGNTAYMPFYYVSGYEYYEDWNGPMKQGLDTDLNMKEWVRFGENKFSAKDAAAFIYTYPLKDLNNLYYHIEQNKPLSVADSIQYNGMTQWFLKNKDLEALGYLMYAKKCEANAGSTSAWEAPVRDPIVMEKMIKNGLQLHKAARKDFFLSRYAYQIVRMAFYSDDYRKTLELSTALLDHKTSDGIMYYRCLSLNAGAYYKLGDYNTAAYLYSLAFNGTDDNKLSNYISYNWCFRPHGSDFDNGPRADKKSTLAKAQNNQEKAVIYIMDALHEYDDNGLPLMAEAYRLDEKVNGLEVVMTREINKLEQSVLTPLLNSKNGFNNYNYSYSKYALGSNNEENNKEKKLEADRQRKKLEDLILWAQKVNADKRSSRDAAFWPLSVAHLFLIQQDWQNCTLWIAKAEKLNPEGNVKDMLHLEKLLLEINQHQKLDAAIEERILPSMKWLAQKALKEPQYAISYRNLMTSVLPNVYIKQQDTLKALLCIAKGSIGANGNGLYSSWYPSSNPTRSFVDPGFSIEMEQVTTANIIALKTWIAKAKKTPFENWMVKYQPYQAGALDMYIATRYLRQHDFANTVVILKAIPSSMMKNYVFQDPFVERWIDTQEPTDTNMVFDKYKFAIEMLQLQSGIKNADALQLYRYANGLYSMTYYGLAWKTAMYYRSGSDGLAYYSDSSRTKLLPEYRKYYSAEEPMKYYQLAYEKATEKELKAKCLFMLSKCWQKNAPVSADRSFYHPAGQDDYFLYNMQSPYLKALLEYKESATFKSLQEDCAYLRSYVIRTSKQ